MRTLEEINADIKSAKANKKIMKKQFSKSSHEYLDACDELYELKNEYSFSELYLD